MKELDPLETVKATELSAGMTVKLRTRAVPGSIPLTLEGKYGTIVHVGSKVTIDVDGTEVLSPLACVAGYACNTSEKPVISEEIVVVPEAAQKWVQLLSAGRTQEVDKDYIQYTLKALISAVQDLVSTQKPETRGRFQCYHNDLPKCWFLTEVGKKQRVIAAVHPG